MSIFETGIPLTICGKKYLYYEGVLLPAIYGGAEPEGENDPPQDPPAPPDLNTIIAAVTKEVGKHIRTSLKPIQEQLKTLDTWRQDVDNRFKPPETEEGDSEPPPQEGDGEKKPPAKAQDGTLKKQLRELNEQVSSLRAANKAAEDRAHEVAMRERVANRDRILSDSLNQHGVVSLDGGLKYFRDDLTFDEETEEWSFSTKDGARYTIPEMVQKFTPDWLKKPAQQGGGSGGGTPRGGLAQNKAIISQVRTLHDKAQQSSSQSDSLAYWRARKDALAKGITPQELDAAV